MNISNALLALAGHARPHYPIRDGVFPHRLRRGGPCGAPSAPRPTATPNRMRGRAERTSSGSRSSPSACLGPRAGERLFSMGSSPAPGESLRASALPTPRPASAARPRSSCWGRSAGRRALAAAASMPVLDRIVLSRLPALPASHPSTGKEIRTPGIVAAFICVGETARWPVTTAGRVAAGGGLPGAIVFRAVGQRSYGSLCTPLRSDRLSPRSP